MRRVEASLLIRRRVRDVWRQASSLESWQALTSAFAGSRGSFFYAVTSGPSSPPGVGTALAVTTRRGRSVMNLRVSLWEPPKRLEFTAERKGWLTSYNLMVSIRLHEIDEDRTTAEIAYVVLFNNKFVELCSLLLPVRALYRRRLRKVLLELNRLALAAA